MKLLAPVLGLFLALAAVGAAAQAVPGPVKVVYHVSETEQAPKALEYLRNHLEADPKAIIVVVTHARGVDFLMKGAKSPRGNEYRTAIEDLQLQGVSFRVCEITLRERSLRRDQFLPEVQFVPSGVAEVARLQSREGYAYLRP